MAMPGPNLLTSERPLRDDLIVVDRTGTTPSRPWRWRLSDGGRTIRTGDGGFRSAEDAYTAVRRAIFG